MNAMTRCRRTGFAAAILLLTSLTPSSASAKLNLIVEIIPVGVLFSSRLQGFTVSKAGLTDRISSSASFTPIERIGVAVETPSGSVDLTAGAGLLVNDGLLGSIYTGDAAWRFKIGKTASLAPHVGVVSIMPRWLGLKGLRHSSTNDVSISDGVGAMPGLTFAAGKMIGFTASADYLIMPPLNVTAKNGWTANRSTIDLSGFMLRIGVVFRFFQSAAKP